MRCRNKQKPIYFKEFLIFFLHSKCDMKLRLSILRSDIFLFCKNSSRRTHCVQMRMSPNNFDIFEVNKLRFQDEKCDFWKILRLSWKDKYEKRCGLGVLFHGLKHFISFRELIPKNSKNRFFAPNLVSNLWRGIW